MPFAGAVPMTASRVLGLSWYSAPGITQRDGKPAPQIRRTKIMSDNRKYYYLKLKESYFDDDAIVLLESMQDGMLYSNILLKLYLKSLKYGGTLQLDENIPYTAQMIATITRQQVGTVERALQIFMKLGLVEPLDNGALYMSNIELFIGQSSTEGERKRRARMKISEQKRLSGQVSETKADICPPEIEIKKEIDIEIEKERESEPGRAAPAAYGRYENVILTDTELSELKAELPDKWEYYIDRLSGYIASTGRKYKNHAVCSTAASAGHRKKPIFQLIRLPCSGVTDTRQSVTASGRSAWSVKPPNSRESTGTR